MGKYVLLITVAALSLWGFSMAQLQSEQQAAEEKADHQRTVLARRVAHTGLNVIRSEARRVASEDNMCPADIAGNVSEIEGTDQSGNYEDGKYKAQIEPVPSIDHTLRATSKGTYDDQTVEVEKLLEVKVFPTGFLYSESGEPGEMAQYNPSSSDGGFKTHPQIDAMGPLEADLDGDGRDEIPYVRQGSAKIEMIDSESEQVQTLVNNSDAKKPATSKIRLGVGSWGGGDPSVFYANENGDAIYKVSWDPNEGGNKNQNDPEKVADLYDSGDRNEVDAVVGIANINGDGDKELIYADGDQELRYIDEPGDGDEVDPKLIPTEDGNAAAGSDQEGIGAGTLVDPDGDGVSSVVFVNGSNNIQIVNDAEEDAKVDRTIQVDNASDGDGPGADETSPTVADINEDGSPEVLYVVDDGEHVQRVDYNPDNPGSPSVKTLSSVSVNQGPGLQSTSTASLCDDGGS
jgi:hypothetical protein